jgi:uncharacterized membrane protein YoaK (UPF0700 family)
MSTADRISTNLMLLLSFGTGVLDAATYLGLHGVFTANMTGNVVFVGLGLAGDDQDVPLLRSALALVGFMVGAAAVGLLQRGRKVVRNRDGVAAVTLMLTAGLMSGCAAALAWATLSTRALDLLTGLIAFAMGAQAVAARRVGVADVTTVVVTSTLAGLAAESPWTGRLADGRVTWRRFSAVLTMGAGAVVGAFMLRFGVAVPVAFTSLILLLVAAVSTGRAVRARRPARVRATEHEGLEPAER